MAVKAKPSFSLKDDLFNVTTVTELAHAVRGAYPRFKTNAFVTDVLAGFPELELKARITFMAEQLRKHLPKSYPRAREILLNALPAPLDPTKTDDDFGKFIWAVPTEFVAMYGCSEEHLNTSLEFLHAATQRFSAENAIRPFLIHFPRVTMGAVRNWTQDSNYHVRRLASEGIRPLLPWAPRVPIEPAEVVEILHLLHADPTRYVTRSVANNLNDIAKSDPSLVYKTLAEWHNQSRQAAPELDWMTRHALRTLKKSFAPEALSLLGYSARPRVQLASFDAHPVVRIGENLRIQAEVLAGARQKLAITLRVEFLKANGTHSDKVFVLADGNYAKNESIAISKRIAFRPMTTRTLYPGAHFAHVVVNGQTIHSHAFELKSD